MRKPRSSEEISWKHFHFMNIQITLSELVLTTVYKLSVASLGLLKILNNLHMWQIKSSRKFTLDFTRHENETLFLESVSGRRRNYWKFLFSENFCGKWKKNMWKKVLRSRGKLKKSFGKMILLMTTTFAIFPHQKNRWHARNFKILSYSLSNYGNVWLIWGGLFFSRIFY